MPALKSATGLHSPKLQSQWALLVRHKYSKLVLLQSYGNWELYVHTCIAYISITRLATPADNYIHASRHSTRITIGYRTTVSLSHSAWPMQLQDTPLQQQSTSPLQQGTVCQLQDKPLQQQSVLPQQQGGLRTDTHRRAKTARCRDSAMS